MIVGIGCQSRGLEAELFIFEFERDKLIRDSTPMNLADTIDGACSRRSRDTYSRIAVLTTGEGDARAMDCISTDNIKDFGVLLACRAEGAATSRDIIKEIFYL